MRSRREWSGYEWLVCFLCRFAGSRLLAGAYIQMLRDHFAIVPLLLGAGSVLTALSRTPGLLSCLVPSRNGGVSAYCGYHRGVGIAR